jgi:hypothetical protein
MVIIPREKPVLEKLNIYYLDIKKLLEHYQGEIGTGGVYFKSHAAEGVVFFDKDELLNGHFKDKTIEISGAEAIERLLGAGDQYNFNVTIYEISEDEVYYWASIPTAEKIYKDLSTEFTDLEGLIKKMISEKLTGYIDVSIEPDKEDDQRKTYRLYRCLDRRRQGYRLDIHYQWQYNQWFVFMGKRKTDAESRKSGSAAS